MTKRIAQFHHYKTLLLGDKDYKELLHGTGISGIFTIVGMGLGYIVTVLSARWFGADSIGLLGLTNTIIIFGTALTGLGIQGSVVRYINQFKIQGQAGKIRSLYHHIILLNIPFSLGISLILYLSKDRLAMTIFHEPRMGHLIMLLAIIFPFLTLKKIGMEMLKGYKELIIYHSIEKIALYGIQLAIVIVIYMTTKNIYGPTYALLIARIVGYILMIGPLRKQYKQLPTKKDFPTKELLYTSLPMMITVIAHVITNQTDIVMLGIYTDTREVGIYTSAFRLAKLVPFGLLMVNMMMGQKIAEIYWSNNKEKLQNLLKLGAGISISIAMCATIIFTLFATQWMSIFGQEFITGALLLQILCIGQLINAGAGSSALYLNVTGRQRILQWMIVGASLVNVILNLILIPLYQAEGAAIASAISLSLGNILMIRYIRKKDKIKTYYSIT